MEPTVAAQLLDELNNGHAGVIETILSSISEALFGGAGWQGGLNPRTEELFNVRGQDVVGKPYDALFRQIAG